MNNKSGLLALGAVSVLVLSIMVAASTISKALDTVVTNLNKTNKEINLKDSSSSKEATESSKESTSEPATIDVSQFPTLKMRKKNFALIYGPIGDNANQIAALVREKTTKTLSLTGSDEEEPFYILIDSPGGSVITGAAIISAIEAAEVPVHTVCLQLCASMGAMIHQYGKKRLNVNRSILMFHDASGGFNGPLQQILSQMGMINRYVDKMFRNVTKRSKQNHEEFLKRVGSEIWVDGEDSLAQNYSDGLVNVIFNEKDAVNPPSDEIIFLQRQMKEKLINFNYMK